MTDLVNDWLRDYLAIMERLLREHPRLLQDSPDDMALYRAAVDRALQNRIREVRTYLEEHS